MKIFCFGDSLTAAGGHDGRFSGILQHRFPRLQIINAGYGGKTLAVTYEPRFRHKPQAVQLHVPPVQGIEKVSINGQSRPAGAGAKICL